MYIPNASFGDRFERLVCTGCIHNNSDTGCGVWDLHFNYMHEYKEGNKVAEMLDFLIPDEDHCIMRYDCPR